MPEVRGINIIDEDGFFLGHGVDLLPRLGM